MTIRLEPKVRKTQILDAALAVALASGYQNVTRDAVAKKAECSPGSVSNYFETMPQMKRAIMRAAVNQKILAIIAQGLVVKDPQALKAPDDIKQAALASIL